MPSAASPSRFRTTVRVVMHLALPVLLLAGCDADVQGQRPTAGGGSSEADGYRLTMPMLRKALSALYAPEAQTVCEPGEGYGDSFNMSVTEMQQRLDRCAPVKRAAAAQGVTTRELALVLKAYMQAGYRMAQEEAAKARGATLPPLPAGPLRDNVALLRANDAELGRLTSEN